MASSGFCTTCTKVVYFSEAEDAHCPVCSGPLIGQTPDTATETADAEASA